MKEIETIKMCEELNQQLTFHFNNDTLAIDPLPASLNSIASHLPSFELLFKPKERAIRKRNNKLKLKLIQFYHVEKDLRYCTLNTVP